MKSTVGYSKNRLSLKNYDVRGQSPVGKVHFEIDKPKSSKYSVSTVCVQVAPKPQTHRFFGVFRINEKLRAPSRKIEAAKRTKLYFAYGVRIAHSYEHYASANAHSLDYDWPTTILSLRRPRFRVS